MDTPRNRVVRDAGTFTQSEAAANPAAVVAHATATGRAVVVGDDDGREITIITIPTTDLPPLDID